jgi:hypothetical protein
VVYAMPAHPEDGHPDRAAVRRQNAEPDMDSTAASWKRHQPSNQMPAAALPVGREACAGLADLQRSGGFGDDDYAGAGGVHAEQDSRRFHPEVPKDNR